MIHWEIRSDNKSHCILKIMTNNIHDFTNGCRQNISIGILWNNIYNHKVGVGLGKGVENEVDWYLLIAKCKLQACFCGYMIWKAQASFSPFHPKLKYVTNGTSPSIFMSTGWTPNWSSVCGYKLPKANIHQTAGNITALLDYTSKRCICMKQCLGKQQLLILPSWASGDL